MEILADLRDVLILTGRDVLPIVVILALFQVLVLRRPIADRRRVIIGFCYVIVGLALFLLGLQQALFPLGRIMARQLADADFVGTVGEWTAYGWLYAFAGMLAFATTLAEPALIAVGLKAEQVSGRSISALGLRIAVAFGVATGVALGALRIVTGIPLYAIIVCGYMVVMVQTRLAPKAIVPLAYDSGGVSTSTVTVPLVMALGLELAGSIPGRDLARDGFGLIALAVLFPMITVMGYAQAAAVWERIQRGRRRRAGRKVGPVPPGNRVGERFSGRFGDRPGEKDDGGDR